MTGDERRAVEDRTQPIAAVAAGADGEPFAEEQGATLVDRLLPGRVPSAHPETARIPPKAMSTPNPTRIRLLGNSPCDPPGAVMSPSPWN
jgi:hypothetical protein